MSEQGPTVFNGRYELLRHLASGGMADVYLARDDLLGREVALKVLFPEFANDPSFVERFRREAQAAANLNHPNIVGIYDWGQERGTYYIVMEYVEGRSISDVLRSTGPLHPDRAAEIAADVASALGAAHAAGLVHRDVKLGNILISDDGDVKVADFGIATALAGSNDPNLTQSGTVMGTATYFSPEQAQGKPLDGRSDLYSLGVVLDEMLTGRPPFRAETPVAVAYKHVQDKPVPPSQAGASVAQSLEAITLKLLAKNPANRYPVAEDLRSDLRRYLAGAHRLPGAAAAGGAAAAASAPGAAAAKPPSAPAPVVASPAQPVAVPQPAVGHHTPTAGPVVDATAAIPASYPHPGEYYYDDEPPRSDGWIRTALLLVGLAILVGVLGFLVVAFLRTLGVDDEGETPVDDVVEPVDVPNVLELSLADAEIELRSLGLETVAEFEVNTALDPNIVFRQDPPAGQRLEPGDTVTLTVSQGENPSVPPVRGRSEAEARTLLEAAGYVVIVNQEANQAEAGTVIGQDPPTGTELTLGDAVTITVSSG
ncbi:MAG: Stk1 family PASTA domain-containing Ser/Thr kinase, partial [Acidimicrobiales bacterium]